MRIGIGYDVHRLAAGRRLVIGGVEIPFDRGLEGHSDADVLIHAICDALLGAAALGDIGSHFPDSRAEFAGIDSRLLLARVRELLAAAGFSVVSLDSVIIAEKPKMAPFIDAMRAEIARVLELEPGAVGIKATTTEGLGFTGRGEGIAAQAVALITHA